MSIRISTVVLVLASSLTVFACSSSSDNNGENQTSNPGPGNNGGNNVPTAFDGNWTEACNGAEGIYSVTNYAVNGSAAVVTLFSYEDVDCAIPALPSVVVTEVSLTYPGGTTTTAEGEATHVNTMIESVIYDGAVPTDEQEADLQRDGFYDLNYDLFLVDGNNLLAGAYTDELDGSTAAKRPVALDTVVFAVRQ